MVYQHQLIIEGRLSCPENHPEVPDGLVLLYSYYTQKVSVAALHTGQPVTSRAVWLISHPVVTDRGLPLSVGTNATLLITFQVSTHRLIHRLVASNPPRRDVFAALVVCRCVLHAQPDLGIAPCKKGLRLCYATDHLRELQDIFTADSYIGCCALLGLTKAGHLCPASARLLLFRVGSSRQMAVTSRSNGAGFYATSMHLGDVATLCTRGKGTKWHSAQFNLSYGPVYLSWLWRPAWALPRAYTPSGSRATSLRKGSVSTHVALTLTDRKFRNGSCSWRGLVFVSTYFLSSRQRSIEPVVRKGCSSVPNIGLSQWQGRSATTPHSLFFFFFFSFRH